jgi:hypothetical protein
VRTRTGGQHSIIPINCERNELSSTLSKNNKSYGTHPLLAQPELSFIFDHLTFPLSNDLPVFYQRVYSIHVMGLLPPEVIQKSLELIQKLPGLIQK